MALETGTFISDLVTTNPVASDPLAFADDHLRLIKSTVKATFPNIAGAVTKTHTEINTAVDQAAASLARSGGTMTGAITLSGNASADLHAVPRQQVVSLIQAMYPVGSVYINATNATNPGTLLGFGTWTAFGAGRVPVGFDSTNPLFDTAEETGGSADAVVVSHTHTATSTVTDPGHFHNSPTADEFQYYGSSGITGNGPSGLRSGLDTLGITQTKTTGITVATTVASSGVSGTNANYQPYITVYMWKRTA